LDPGHHARRPGGPDPGGHRPRGGRAGAVAAHGGLRRGRPRVGGAPDPALRGPVTRVAEDESTIRAELRRWVDANWGPGRGLGGPGMAGRVVRQVAAARPG